MVDNKELNEKDNFADLLKRVAEQDGSEASNSPLEEADSTVKGLKAELDTLAGQLRQPVPADPYADESALRRGLSLVEAIGREPSFVGETSPESIADEDLGSLREYKLLSKLGQGGMGTVYKALHTKLDKIVALKVLPTDKLQDKHAVVRFEREMKAVGRLEHPNIVRATDAGEVDGKHFLVMEHVDGFDLSSLVRSTGPLPVADACEMIRQAAIGLQHASEHGLVHRDIKPSNIMVQKVSGKEVSPASGPSVKILDMGLALLEEHRQTEQRDLTSTGQVMGTLDYMAPEQGENSHEVDIRADIYSLGATFFKLLCGKAPFAGEKYKTPMQVLLAIANEPAPLITDQRSDVPTELAAIVNRMLQKKPDDRFATPQEIAEALTPFTEGCDLAGLLIRAESKSEVETEDATLIRTADHLTSPSSETDDDATHLARAASDLPDRFAETKLAQPLPGAAAKKRGPLTAIGLALALVSFFAAAMIIHIKTDYGDLVITSDDDNVEFTVKRHNGEPVDGFELTGGKGQKKLRTGKYEVIITGANADEFKITDSRVTLSRGNTETVTIERRVKEAVAATQPANSVAADYAAERNAAEWVLSIGGKVFVSVNGDESKWQAMNVKSLGNDILKSELIDDVEQLPDADFLLTCTHFKGNQTLKDEDFANLRGLKSLRAISASYTEITNNAAKQLEGISTLTHFEAVYTNLGNEGIKYFDHSLLTSLALRKKHESLSDLSNQKHLTDLRIHGKNTDDDLRSLSDLRDLRSLALEGGSITDAGLKHLAGLKLEHLSLKLNPMITGKGLVHLKTMPLKMVILNDTKTADISVLKTLHSLTDLRLERTLVSTEAVAALKLALPNCNITSDFTEEQIAEAMAKIDSERKAAEWVLSVNGQLLELQGDFTHGRSQQNVTSADDLPEQPFVITRLGFSEDSIIEDRDLENIKGLNLKELHVGNSSITDAGFDKIESELSHVRYLYLSYSQITDLGLQKLGSYQIEAERLYLIRTQVTDKGLDHLKVLKHLRILNLAETKVTADGIAALNIALPKCEITSSFTEEQIAEAMAKIDPGNAPLVMKNIAERPSDDELLKRLSAVDWQPGDAASLEGYASFPTKHSGIPFEWQILPKFAQHNYDYSVSPTGTYVAVYHDQNFDPYIRILERTTGRLVGVFYNRSRYERKICWSPDETKFVVSWWNWNLLHSTICRLDGTILADWSYERSKNNSTPVPAWSPDSSRILFVGTKSLEQRTQDGKVVESFAPPEHGGMAFGHAISQLNSFWSPQGNRFAVANEGEIRVYSKDGGQPIAVLKDENGLALYGCMWHPSGEKILTNGVASPGETGAARLWTLSGESIHFAFRNLHEAVSGFSPDGRFLITNYGDIRDMADNSISKLDINQFGGVNVGPVDVRWTESDRIIMFSISKGAGVSVEFSPAGKKLAEYDHPIPIPQNSLSWMRNPDHFHSIGTTPNETWRYTWQADSNEDSSVKLPKTLRGFVAFSPTNNEYAGTNDNRATNVFDEKGKLQRTIDAKGNGRLCSWNPDGTLLATASGHLSGGPIEIWRGEEKLTSLEGHKHEVLGLTWSPNGSYLAVWDSSLKVSIWDINAPEKPVIQRIGYGFQLGRTNNYWSSNFSCPRWSADGERLAVPTETAVLLVSPIGAEDISVPMKKEKLGVIWWRPDGQALIVGKTIYELTGKNIGKLAEDNNSIPFLNWISDEKLVTAWHRSVGIYDQVDQPATVLSLPGFSHNKSSRVSMILRGMNAERVSSDQRYLIHHSGVAPTSPDSHGGGDVYLIDLQKKNHLWTGLAYNDGTQVRIAPTGRVQSAPEDFDKYLTYVIRYSTGRIIPQTRIQFASRVNLSTGRQLVQQTLDFGGTVSVAGQDVPLVGNDLNDARDLPAIDAVIGIDLSGNQYLNDSGLEHFGELTSLEHLQLQNNPLTTKGLSEIAKLNRLRTLNLSGLKITNSVSAYLPSKIEALDISHTEIGDFMLFDLKTFKSLKHLNLTGTKVSPAGIASLKQALPDCQVIASQVPKTEAANAQ